eukprot:g11904.t1
MVNPVGKIAVATGLAAVGLHKAYGDMKREQERKAAEVERKREQAVRQDFRDEMARASQASAAQRRAQQQRSDHSREAFAELTELRVSLMGRALGDLRKALAEDFCRESSPLSAVGLPLIGRADSVDFAIAAVLLAWGDDEMLERFWPRKRTGEGGHGGHGEEEEEGEGVDSVQAYRVGFCVQRCSPQTLKVVQSWLKKMAKVGPAGEWTLPMEDRAEREEAFGPDHALFGIPSGPPRFYRTNDEDDVKLHSLALGTFMKSSEPRAVTLKIRCYAHFQAVSSLGHVDLVLESGMEVTSIVEHRGGTASAKFVTQGKVGTWEGAGLYVAANFPLRTFKPQAPTRRQRNVPTGRQGGAGYAIKNIEMGPPDRRGRSVPCNSGDIHPLTQWLPSEKAWRRASAKEAFAQSMLSSEAAALVGVLTPRACEGGGLWHFLAASGEPQAYAMSLLGILESRDAGLLTETGKGKGEEVARVLTAALRKVVPPPAVREGGSRREAMAALDAEIGAFVHGCYLELLRSLYALPMENFAGRTPADIVSSSVHYKLWSNVLAYVPNQPKLLRLALRDMEAEKRAAARATSRGSAPVWWTVLMAVAVLGAIVVLFVCTWERNLSKSLFFLFGGGRLPAWVADRVCSVLALVDPVTAPVVVVTILEIFLKYCRPPAVATTEDGDDRERSGLGAALLWRFEAANEISCNLFRAVALATGLTPPGRRSREELMLKCEEWLRIWGLRQLHSNMASAARRGRITKQAVLQLTDGIFLYRAEQEAAAAAAAAAEEGSPGARVTTACSGQGTLPGSVEEAEAFLNLPVVGRDGDDSSGGGEEWVDTPLPGSAVEGALNMAVFSVEEDDATILGALRSLEAEGVWGGGGGSSSDGEDSDDSEEGDEDDDDDDDDDGGGGGASTEQTQYRQRCMPTEERSYQRPVPVAEAQEGAATRSSRRLFSGTGERKGSDDGAGGDGGGGTEGMKNTVKKLLARRGWTFNRGAGAMAYVREARPARANTAPPTRAEVRQRFVDSKTFWHNSVGVGGQWIKSVKEMMEIRPVEEVLARLIHKTD